MISWEVEADLADEFTVRHPRQTDRKALTDLYLKAWLHTYEKWGLGWSREKILEELYFEKQDSKRWLVCFHGSRMVGLLRHSSCHRKLEVMFVDPSFLRTGAGYALMREYLWRVSLAHRDRPPTLFLEVFTDLERAVRFFGYFGFTDSGLGWTSSTTQRECRIFTATLESVSRAELAEHFGGGVTRLD